MSDRPRLVLATRNDNKIAEIRSILAGVSAEILTLHDFPHVRGALEDGATFEANARKKALHVWSATGLASLADDSGLEVDELGGRPGVLSARFSGEHANYAKNNEKLLGLLEGVPREKRRARFVCVAALAAPDGSVTIRTGELKGYICERPAGSGGFGYDPVFFLPEYGQTVAELDPQTKNKISHRAQAFIAMKAAIADLTGGCLP